MPQIPSTCLTTAGRLEVVRTAGKVALVLSADAKGSFIGIFDVGNNECFSWPATPLQFNEKGYVGSVLASATKFRDPSAVRVRPGWGGVFWGDDAENLFVVVVDSGNHMLRQVSQSTTGFSIYPLVGSPPPLTGPPVPGFLDGVGTNSRFRLPRDALFLDKDRLLVADSGNHALRLVTFSTPQTAGEWRVTTVVGTMGTQGQADGNAGSATLNTPVSLARASAILVLIADSGNNKIRAYNLASGKVYTLAGQGTAGYRDGAGVTALFTSPRSISMLQDDTAAVVDRSQTVDGRGLIRLVDVIPNKPQPLNSKP